MKDVTDFIEEHMPKQEWSRQFFVLNENARFLSISFLIVIRKS